MKKHLRHKLITQIVSEHKISKQEEILQILKEKEILITQATLSRDLKELNAGRYNHNDVGHIYFIPNNKNAEKQDINGIVDIKFSKNICIIKTLSGYANSICVKIDDEKIKEIVGTIAGNDTIFIAMDENQDKNSFIKILNHSFKNINRLYKF